MTDIRRRILYIDAYDSFANNIISLLRLSLDVDVEVITHDEYKDAQKFQSRLEYFDAVVVGPGPGDPRNQQDVGVIRQLWHLPKSQILPVLGICLGFQDLCRAYGGEVKKLSMPRHGVVSRVTPIKEDIFADFQAFEATNYHSLHVDLHHNQTASFDELSRPSSACPDIQPLAWDTEDPVNGRVLLAARHVSKPFWAVQYHPESICTSDQGSRIVSSWWQSAIAWLDKHPRLVNRAPFPRLCRQVRAQESKRTSEHLADNHLQRLQQLGLVSLGSRARWRRLYRHVPDVNELCKDLGFNTGDYEEAILLRSGKQKDGSLFGQGLGRFSIIGVVDAETIHLQYDVHSKMVKLYTRNESLDLPSAASVQNIFSYIKQFMSAVQVGGGPVLIPFWGGLMGYISYEAGLESIDVQPTTTMTDCADHKQRPDINFAFVTRSIVLDHALDTIYIQSIRNDDSSWLEYMRSRLENPQIPHLNGAVSDVNGITPPKMETRVDRPNTASYNGKIDNCLESIRAGDSYEICLTAQTTVKLPRYRTPFASGWKLFQRLSITNPAPFSSFVRLHSSSDVVTIISSSPERFLSWSRAGHCQFRPIKGTVKKAPGVTYKHARAILESSKERAENLMITDLIRHDLHGVAHLGSVSVPKLMQIEEYATVYQLVSVIEGDISQPQVCKSNLSHLNGTVVNGTHGVSTSSTTTSTSMLPHSTHHHTTAQPLTRGIDLLAASLPPGSMTGAPKRRSCTLISSYESPTEPRGIYSGVLGYLDVGGGADFAVVIRTAVRWDGDAASSTTTDSGRQETIVDKWTVGAGGAITAQSNPQDEFAEMMTKLESTLGAFSSAP